MSLPLPAHYLAVLSIGLALTHFGPTAQGQRATLTLDGPWSFLLDTTRTETPAWFRSGLPADQTRTVDVPHTWNVEPGLEEARGIGWYERSIDIPADWRGRTIRLRFGAAYHTARIWVNGHPAGEHIGSGYTPFLLDVTSLVRTGRANRITVSVDNEYSRSNIPFLNSFDWPNDGGLIRSVSAEAVPPTGIERIHVTGTPSGCEGETCSGSASVRIVLRVPNASSKADWAVDASLTEENQPSSNVVWEGTPKPRLSGESILFDLDLPAIRPWHVDHPNLYRLTIHLRKGAREIDEAEAVFGFREVRVEGTRIVLNGEPVRLMGVEWMPGSSTRSGMAESKEELEEVLGKMKSVNATFTRFHWQQDEAVYAWADRNGLLIQEEIPYWGPSTLLNDTLLALGKSHLDEMIAAHFNHPSIFAWGIGNELDSHRPDVRAGLEELYRYAKQLDPSRLVNYVSNRLQNTDGRDASEVGDMLWFNEYQDTWYQSDPALIGEMVDRIHAAYPDKPLIISEYGLCEPANQGGDERRLRDMIYHTAVFESRPYISGAIYFSLNDYRTHIGEAGEGTLRQRIHGVFDIDGREKPSADALRRLSAPVELLNVPWNTGHPLSLVVIASRGLPSFTLRGYSLGWKSGDGRVDGSSPLPVLPPGEKTTVHVDDLPPGEVTVSVLDPRGRVVLERRFEVR